MGKILIKTLKMSKKKNVINRRHRNVFLFFSEGRINTLVGGGQAQNLLIVKKKQNLMILVKP